MKRLFRPRNLIILAIIGVVVVAFAQKKRHEQELAAMSDDEVRDRVHEKIGGRVGEEKEEEITEKVIEKKHELAGSAADS
jgi:hypothetical protein